MGGLESGGQGPEENSAQKHQELDLGGTRQRMLGAPAAFSLGAGVDGGPLNQERQDGRFPEDWPSAQLCT